MASSLRTNHPAMAPPRNQQGQSQQQHHHQQRRPAHPTHRGPAAAGGRRPGGVGDPSLLNMADAQWLDFAEPGFDPAEYAEGFFLTHSEAEADERCAELMTLRYQTQDLLRQKVSGHYQLFMRGTEDIQHVEQDIARLRRLVARMQESLRFLDAASAIVLATDSTLMPSTAAISAGVGGDRMSLRMPQGGGSGSSANSHGGRGTMGPGTVAGNRMSVQRGASPPLLSSATLAAAGASGGSSSHLPKWVAGSVEELERLCIEKQRGAAVALIEKVRSYFVTVATTAATGAAGTSVGAAGSAMVPAGAGHGGSDEVLGAVNRRADELAAAIVRDLETLHLAGGAAGRAGGMSASVLFDFGDAARQLRMLILLGKANTAVDFFIRNRGAMVEAALRLLEAGGDTLSYVTLLSQRFFALLTEACAAFDALFADQTGRVRHPEECFARLVLWIDAEARRYASLVGRQLSMTRRDLVGTKHFRCPNAHAAAPSAHAHAGSAAIAASHRPASIAMAAAPPVTGPGVGAAAMAPHELISATRSSLLLKMSSLPQSPLAQSPHAAVNHRHSGRVFAFNAAPGGKALVMTPRGSLPRAHSVLGDASVSSAAAGAAGAGGAVGEGKVEEEVLCDEAFVTIGACLEACFALAGQMDPLGVPVKPTMAEVLAHDLKALLSGVARAAIARLTDAVAAEASTVSSSSASNANSPIIPEGQQQPQQQSGAAGPVPVPAERLLMQLPSALAARDVVIAGEETTTTTDTTAPASFTEGESSAGAAAALAHHEAVRRAASGGSAGVSSQQLSVLPSALLLLHELNGLLASWAMLQETRGATARYAEALGPVLDPHLLREVLALLRAYPELVEARVLGTGPKAGVVVGGKAPGGAGKKKVTAAEVKERGLAIDTLEALASLTLFHLKETWVKDPLLLVDGAKAAGEHGGLKPVQEAYVRLIEALSEGTDRAPSALLKPAPSSPVGGPTTGALSAAASTSPRTAAAAKKPGTSSPPTSAFSRLSMARGVGNN